MCSCWKYVPVGVFGHTHNLASILSLYSDQHGLSDVELQLSVSQASSSMLPRRVKDADLVMALEDIQRLSAGLLQMEKNC